MAVPNRQIYYFADIEVDALRGYLRRGGEEQRLRPKTFQVLVYLIEHRGGDISKVELFRDIWKDTAVVDDVLVQSIKDIRRALGDDTRHPRFVRTIPKFGYRFIGELEDRSINGEDEKADLNGTGCQLQKIETEKLNIESPEKSSENQKPQTRLRYRPILKAISLSAILVTLLGFVILQTRQINIPANPVSQANVTNKTSLLVLFFENQSNDAELDWLREGLPDMLITDFSQSDKLAVLSRGHLHVLLERMQIDPQGKIGLETALDIARRTENQMVMTGSFARFGDRVRIDVQLYETKTGQMIASESLTADTPEQILNELDLLSLKLADRLGINEDPREKIAGIGDLMTTNLEAYRFYSLGVEKAQALQNKEAIELLEKAVALDPQFAMAHARIGYAYAVTWDLREQGKPHLERAFQLSERLTEKDRLSIIAWYSIANLDFENAIRQFRQIIAGYPLEIEAYERLARLLYGEGRLEEALGVLKQGLTVDAKAKNLYNQLGGVLSLLGRHAEAISMEQRYVALAPSEPNAYDSLGMMYQWAGDYQSAVDNYNQALRLKPDFDIALVHLANTKFQLGQYKEAIELYRRYLKNAPSDGERLRGLTYIAAVYLKKKELNSAEKTAKDLLKIQKDQLWASFILARIHNDSPGMQKLDAEISHRTLSNRGSKNTQRLLFYDHGYTALKNGRAEEAIASFQEALRQPPPTWEAETLEDCLADAYLELGRLDEAALEYERILQLNPNFPLARYHLAQIYQRKGLPEQARESYRQFLETWKNADPDIPEVIAAKEFIAQ